MTYKRRMEAPLSVGLFSSVAVHRDSGIVFTGHEDSKIVVWKVAEYSPMLIIAIDRGRILSLEWVEGYLWVGLGDGSILVLDSTRDWAVIKDWRAHNTGVMHLQRSSDPSLPLILSSSEQGSVSFWDSSLSFDKIDAAVRSHESEYCTYKPLDVFMLSYNVNAKKPSDFSIVQQLLSKAPREPDVIVFGLQEIIDLELKKKNAKSLMKELMSSDDNSAKAWTSAIYSGARRVFPNSNYQVVDSKSMVGLLVVVLARKQHATQFVESTTVKTGFGGLHGNKGGVAVRFVIDDSSICFMNTHLAAGHSHFQERCSDIATIYTTAAFSPINTVDSNTFVFGGDGGRYPDNEFCFFFGDMNFRIDMSNHQVRKFAEASNVEALLPFDQLNKLKHHTWIQGFTEGPITFSPTYKYDVGSNVYDTSEKNRSPAWCDRILYRGPNVIQEAYGRQEPTLSDHKPVWSFVRLPIKTIAPSKRQAFIQGARSVVERAETQRAAAALHLRLSNCTGFPVDQAARAIQIVAATVNRRPSALLLDLAVVELAKQQAAAASTNYDFF